MPVTRNGFQFRLVQRPEIDLAHDGQGSVGCDRGTSIDNGIHDFEDLSPRNLGSLHVTDFRKPVVFKDALHLAMCSSLGGSLGQVFIRECLESVGALAQLSSMGGVMPVPDIPQNIARHSRRASSRPISGYVPSVIGDAFRPPYDNTECSNSSTGPATPEAPRSRAPSLAPVENDEALTLRRPYGANPCVNSASSLI